jgi:hypothetical protein
MKENIFTIKNNKEFYKLCTFLASVDPYSKLHVYVNIIKFQDDISLSQVGNSYYKN